MIFIGILIYIIVKVLIGNNLIFRNFLTSKKYLLPPISRIVILVISLMTFAMAGDNKQAEPFSNIECSAGPLMFIGKNDLENYWNYAGGFTINARMPFYFGKAELGANIHSYDGNEVEFNQIHCYLAFLKEIRILEKTYADFGGSVGNSFFLFDTDEEFWANNESELTLGVNGGIKQTFGEHWLTELTIAHTIVYTHHRIENTNLSLKFGYNWRTPQWLKQFLK